MKIDLHTHSSVSDGTDTPAELVQAAREAGLDVVALTDHDTYDGLDAAVAEGERIGVEVVRGLELSCARQGMSVHLLAYGADEADPDLTAELVRVRGGRRGRLGGVLERLEALGVPVSEADVLAQVGDSPSVGRPHIADALVRAGHVRDRTEAFDRFLADLVRDHQLDGIEVDHQDHDAEVRHRLRRLTDSWGVLATGSSDYHGTGKINHDLGVNTTAPDVWAEISRRLAQGGRRPQLR